MRICVLLIGIALPLYCSGAIDVYAFPDDEMRNRYHALIDELRCPQCLNTNLSGSDSMIASDLRREVHRLILEGRTDAEVLGFMFERYGDFILYDPQLKPGTLVLWFGPFVFFLIALGIAFRIATRRRDVIELSENEQARLDQLISTPDSRK